MRGDFDHCKVLDFADPANAYVLTYAHIVRDVILEDYSNDMAQLLKSARRIVVKVGSSLVTNRGQGLDQAAIALANTRQFQQLQDKLTQARASLDGASGALVDAQGRIAAANSPTVITTPEVTKQSRLLPVLRASLITALVAVLLGIGLYTLVDWLAEDRERRTAEDVATEPSLGVPALGRDAPGQERAAPA